MRAFVPFITFACAVAMLACAPADSGTDTPEPVTSIELADLGLKVTGLPEGWAQPASTAGMTIVFEREAADENLQARIHLEPKADRGLNLHDVVRAEPLRWEAFPQGKFHGITELGTHLGPAYLARGDRSVDGVLMQDMVLYTAHPDRDQLLSIALLFPADQDPSQRSGDLFAFAEAVEASYQ